MGAFQSKPKDEAEGQRSQGNKILPANAPDQYKSRVATPRTSVFDSAYGIPSSRFPSELPPRPQRQPRLSFSRKKKATTETLPLPPTLPYSPPLTPTISREIVYDADPTPDPCVSQYHVRAWNTPPTSPVLPSARRKPKGFDDVSHDLRLVNPSPTLSTPPENDAYFRPPRPRRQPRLLDETASRSPLSQEHDRSSANQTNSGRGTLAERIARLQASHFPPTPRPTFATALSLPEETHRSFSRTSNDLKESSQEPHYVMGPSRQIHPRAARESSHPYDHARRFDHAQIAPDREQNLQSNGFDNGTFSGALPTNPFRRSSHDTTQQDPNPVLSERHGLFAPTRCQEWEGALPSDQRESTSHGQRDEVEYPDLGLRAAIAENPSQTSLLDLLSSRSDLARHAMAIQVEEDRRLAEELQQEENEFASWLDEEEDSTDDLVSQLQSAAGHPPTPDSSRPDVDLRTCLSRRPQPAVSNCGTREDPIVLDSESDDSDEEFSLAQSRHGEVIMLDDSSDDELFQEAVSQPHQEIEEVELMQWSASVVSTRDCVVCGDATPIADLPSLANCAHQPETCPSCYASWITSELENKGWRHIKCPGSNCKVTLEYHEVQQYATQEVFGQYDAFATREALNDDPNFRWCRAPDCNSGQIHLSGEEGNIFTCAACGHRVCIVHEETWHEGETCEEYAYRISGRKERDQKAQEEASVQAIGKLTKKCPGPRCLYNIEKNDGCDHMTCSRCKYEFCWLCLADYNAIRRKGNSAHAKECRYHTNQIN